MTAAPKPTARKASGSSSLEGVLNGALASNGDGDGDGCLAVVDKTKVGRDLEVSFPFVCPDTQTLSSLYYVERDIYDVERDRDREREYCLVSVCTLYLGTSIAKS